MKNEHLVFSRHFHCRSLLTLGLFLGPVAVHSLAGVSVTALPVVEGNAAGAVVSFTVQLSAPAAEATVLEYTTAADTAREGEDYLPVRGTLSLAAGQTSAQVEVPLVSDGRYESSESFSLIVWPQGTTPTPALTAIPSPPPDDSRPPFTWTAEATGISEDNWFNGRWVGQKNGGTWLPIREMGLNFNGFLGAMSLAGERLFWMTLGELEGGRLIQAMREKAGFQPWSATLTASLAVNESLAVLKTAVSGDLVAVGVDDKVYVYQVFANQPPRLRSRLDLSGTLNNIAPGTCLAFNGKRLAVAVNYPPHVEIYEAANPALTGWTLKKVMPATAGPLVMEGDILHAYVSDEGLAGGHSLFARNAGGADQWGKVAALQPPAPQYIVSSAPVVMRGGLVLIGDTRDYDFTAVGQGKIHTFTQAPGGQTWAWGGSFLSPAGATGDRFGAALAQGGHDVITVSTAYGTVPAKAWGGSFIGARATILDDDLPVATITGIHGYEPSSNPVAYTALVELSQESAVPVTFTWRTQPGTALSGSDFAASTVQVTIPAGSLSAEVQILLLPDDLVEPEESFSLILEGLSGAVWDGVPVACRITDTDRRAIAYAGTQSLFEGMAPTSIPVGLWPSGIPFTIGVEAGVPAIGEPDKTAADYAYALPGPDWTVSPGQLTSASPAFQNVILTTPSDGRLDRNKTAEMRFILPESAVAASFSTRFVDGFAGFPNNPFGAPSTDGTWVMAPRGNNEEVLSFYRRSAGPEGVWSSASSLPASSIGRTTWGGLKLLLRGGRFLAYDYSTRRAWIFGPAAQTAHPWELEAAITLPPTVTAANVNVDFDGETISIGSHAGKVLLVDRSAGQWNETYWFDAGGLSNSVLPAVVVLHRGKLFFHAPNQGDQNPIFTAARIGNVNQPWRLTGEIRPTVPARPGYFISGLQVEDDLLVVPGPPERLYRFSDSGSWEEEQSFNGGVRLLGRNILINGTSVMGRTGPASAPWQVLGPWVAPVDSSRINGTDFKEGVFVTTVDEFRGLVISEAGAGFYLSEEESFQYRYAIHTSWAEPTEKESLRLVTITSSLPVPVDISIPFRTGTGGTAAAGLDFRPVEGSLVIPAGDTLASFAVPLLPDTDQEGTETLEILMGPPSYGVLQPAAASRFATIEDTPLMVLAPPAPVYFPEPSSGQAVVHVPFQMKQASGQPLNIRYAVAAKTATAADAVLTANGTLSLPAGATVIPVPVTVLADSLTEPVEELEVSLTFIGTQVLSSLIKGTLFIDNAPAAGNTKDAYPAGQNQVLEFDSARNVLSNDTAGLTVVSEGRAPQSGQVVWNANGTFRYTPAPNFTGTDRFAYRASSAGAFSVSSFAFKWLNPLDGKDPGNAISGFHTNWMQPAFNATSWQNGAGLMGYGALGADPGVALGTNIGTPAFDVRYTAYFRISLTAPANPPTGLSLTFTCDDAVIVYLNGTLLGRYAKAPMGYFATAANEYLLTAPTRHDSLEETTSRTLNFPTAQLLPGQNTLAFSVHNESATSSDLGFQLIRADAGTIAPPTYVTITIPDGNQVPLTVPDAYTVAGTDVPLSSLLIGGSVYQNDSLLGPDGLPYDPILESEISGSPVGPVTFNKDTGHFTMAAPRGFFGSTSFNYRIRDKDGWSMPALVTITVAPSQSWDVWRAAKIGGAWNSPDAEPDRDPDGDGLANAFEYLFFREPLAREFAEPLTLRKVDTGWELEFTLSGSRLSEIFIEVETASDPALTTWQNLVRLAGPLFQFARTHPGVTVISTPAGSLLQYTILVPEGQGSPAYFRLRAWRSQNVLNP